MEFGQFLWSLLIIFFMIMYFMILFSVIMDLFRRHDTSGWVKAAWIVALLIVPFISLLIYVIIYGQSIGSGPSTYIASRPALGGSAAGNFHAFQVVRVISCNLPQLTRLRYQCWLFVLQPLSCTLG